MSEAEDGGSVIVNIRARRFASPDFQITEQVLAEEFDRRHGADFVYLSGAKIWLRWSGAGWIEDRELRIQTLASELCREIGLKRKPKERKSIEGVATVNAILTLMKARRALDPDKLDLDEMINMPKGEADLPREGGEDDDARSDHSE